MTLVILGIQDKDFSRLLKKIDQLIANHKIKDEVVVQAGTTKYQSSHMKIFDLIPMTEFNRLIGKADLIITHGGVGSIIQSLKKQKKVIVVPRLKEYGEHTNNHQLQIVNEFSKKGYVIPCTDIENLDDALAQVKDFNPKPYKSNNTQMIQLISQFIDNA